jgi:uncharacterized protein (DUF1330 family)
MSVYVIAQISIHDRSEYGKYEAGFLEVFSCYKGELLVVDENPTVVEGGWPCTRTVVIRFPTEEEARRWYESPEYQTIAQHRIRGSKTNAILARGLPIS